MIHIDKISEAVDQYGLLRLALSYTRFGDLQPDKLWDLKIAYDRVQDSIETTPERKQRIRDDFDKYVIRESESYEALSHNPTSFGEYAKMMLEILEQIEND